MLTAKEESLVLLSLVCNLLWSTPMWILLTLLFVFSSWVQAKPLEPRFYRLSPQHSFVFIYERLDQIFDLCLESPKCGLTEIEKKYLQSIRSSLEQEKQKNPHLLQFDSSRRNRSLFHQDGQTRVAVTGDEVASPVYINLDLVEAIPYHRAIAILTHELGHHQKIKSHEALDQLGLKVEKFFLRQIIWSKITGDHRENQDLDRRDLLIHLATAQFSFGARSSDRLAKNLLWVYDEARLTDISQDFAKKIQCPSMDGPGILTSYRIFNLAWHSYDDGYARDTYRCFPPRRHHTGLVELVTYVKSADLQMTCLYKKNGQEIKKDFPSLKALVHLNFRDSCPEEFPSAGQFPEKFYVFDSLEKVEFID